MMSILNNFRRIFDDDGRDDRDFSDQRQRLDVARAGLLREADGLKAAAQTLADLIKLRMP